MGDTASHILSPESWRLTQVPALRLRRLQAALLLAGLMLNFNP